MSRKRKTLTPRYIKKASSTRYEMPESFFSGKSAAQLVSLGESKIKGMGINMVQRSLIKPTTTMPFTIYLGKKYPTYSDTSKAAILWHEIVHARQWRDPSLFFAFRYLGKRWQWVFESQGYRQQCRVIRALRGDSAARKFARWVPDRLLRAPYTMRSLDAGMVRRETIKVFEAGLPGLRIR